MTTRWSENEDEIIHEHFGRIPATTISRRHLSHRTPGAIRGRALRLGLRSNLDKRRNPFPRFSPSLEEFSDLDFDELWEAAYAFQRASHQLSTRRDPANVYLDVDRPIGIGFIADTHIGAVSTPLDFVRARFDLMAEQPWLYLIGVGDTIDNFLPTQHPQGMFSTMFPPELQKQLVENLYSKMLGRWIAVVQGCHEEFSHIADDFDFTKFLAKELRCVNMGFGGLINLYIGEQLYQIAVRHKYKYNSSFNYTHTCKRLVQMEYQEADIACVAHHHRATVEQLSHRDKDRVYIRPGSMKGPDRYARSLGYTDTGSQIPVVMLWPNERKMLSFLDLDQAIEVFGRVG